jgi:hypothetical protein
MVQGAGCRAPSKTEGWRVMATRVIWLIVSCLSLTGCAHYWYRAEGAQGTLAQFRKDHRECLETGTPIPNQPGYVLIEQSTFRNCLFLRGWRREDRNKEMVPPGYFRSVEDFELQAIAVDRLPAQPRSAYVESEPASRGGSFENTPAQDRAWSAYRVCTAETGANAVMQRVDPDGRYYVRCSDRCTRWTEFTDCMKQKARALRGSP